MPEHLRLLIIRTSQQDNRWMFIVFIWQMGKLRLTLCTRRGRHQKLWRLSWDAGQISLTPSFSSSEWSRNFSMRETPLQCTKYTFLKFTLKGSEVMTLEWVRGRCVYQHSPGDCPTGGLEMTSCAFSRLLPSLVEGEDYSATRRFWRLHCCQAGGCPLLASCFCKQFLNPLSIQANLIPFEPLALEFMLRVRVFSMFIWVIWCVLYI